MRIQPSPVTSATARATVEMHGTVCPRCGETEVVAHHTHLVEGSHYQEMSCTVCGLEWTQAWEVARVLVYGQGENPDIFTMETTRLAPAPLPTIRTDPDRWEPDPNGAWQKIYDPRTLGQVWDDITVVLPAYGVNLDDFDYAGPMAHQTRDRVFPSGYRWLTSFAVRGCSEGWYVHTAVVRTSHDAPMLDTLFLAKTFAGWETAHALVAALNVMLDA